MNLIKVGVITPGYFQKSVEGGGFTAWHSELPVFGVTADSDYFMIINEVDSDNPHTSCKSRFKRR